MPGVLMASVLRMRWSSQKSMHGLVLPFHTSRVMSLQSLVWREVGLRLSWPVISFMFHWCDQYLCFQNANIDFHTPLVPLHQTFHPWSSGDALVNVQRNAQTFLFTHARGVSTVCPWAGGRQFTLCGASSISLPSRVCSSRVVVVHLFHSVCTTVQGGYPLKE